MFFIYVYPSSIFDTLCKTLLSVPHSYFPNFVILGDFNVNFDVSHHFYTHLSDFMTSFSLSQVVTSPTHFSHCGHPSLIDLVFVSNLSHFSTCSIISQLANSDHLGLCVTMKCQHITPPVVVKFGGANMLILRELMSCFVT